MNSYLNSIIPNILNPKITKINNCVMCKKYSKYSINQMDTALKNMIQHNQILLKNYDASYAFIKYLFKSFKKSKLYGFKKYIENNNHLNPIYGYSESVLKNFEIEHHTTNSNEYQYYEMNINIKRFINFKISHKDDFIILPYISLKYSTDNFIDNTIHMIVKVKNSIDLNCFKNNIQRIHNFYVFVKCLNTIGDYQLTTIQINTCLYVRYVILLFYNKNSFKSSYGHYTDFNRIGCTHFQLTPCQLFRVSGHVIPNFYRKSLDVEYEKFTFPDDITRISLTQKQIRARAMYYKVLSAFYENNLKISQSNNTKKIIDYSESDSDFSDSSSTRELGEYFGNVDHIYKPYSSKSSIGDYKRKRNNISIASSPTLSIASSSSISSPPSDVSINIKAKSTKSKLSMPFTMTLRNKKRILYYK
ncbi:hypothetical protein TONV_048 [Tipula oleracea nudivirus]|uniref:Uncharacterized protein n=1 Tax=Tipula oleracea nudivirus TaxID=1546257 RepID=A0A0B4VGL3_9VIRU|nr:hypothetical protein TONV_048 [Tipula oleracea nudivirus]AJD20108.1 hypothetical protein TONV_048 [Tipula oleracea nudivirus]